MRATLFSTLLVLGQLTGSVAPADKQLPFFYHSTDDISKELQRLAKTCSELSIRTEPIDEHHHIDIVSVSGKKDPVSRLFLLAGEHARELITSESALHLIKVLCGEEEQLRDKARDALAQTSFLIIVNGNPVSRKKLRVNENAVDLNRNWKAHWSSKAGSPETFPGKQPFSEPETRIFRKSVTKFKPVVFLSVHSGTLGMYMPWAYKAEEPKGNDELMLRVLEDLDEEFCKCPWGPAGERAGYRSPGTCLDYVYSVAKVPFAYAFEIYAPPSQRQELFRAWESEEDIHDPASDFAGEVRQRIRFAGRYDQEASEEKTEAVLSSCFLQFNPAEKDDYDETLLRWSEVSIPIAAYTRTSPQQNTTGLFGIEPSDGSNHVEANENLIRARGANGSSSTHAM